MLYAAFRVWRRYPVLWLPVFVADWCLYGLERALPYARLWLVEVWPRRRSVLTGDGALSSVPILGVYHGGLYEATFCLRFFVSLLECCLWCSAFVLIGASIRAENDGVSVHWNEGRLWLMSHLRRMALFSGGMLVVFGGVLAFSGMLLIAFYSSRHLGSSLLNTVSLWVGMIALAALACFIAPWALRLLPGGDKLSAGRKRSASVYAFVAVACSSALILLTRSTATEAADEGRAQLTTMIISAIAALPYVPLFIALALLVQKPDGVQEAIGASE